MSFLTTTVDERMCAMGWVGWAYESVHLGGFIDQLPGDWLLMPAILSHAADLTLFRYPVISLAIHPSEP